VKTVNLSSGSKGNSTFISGGGTSILIDDGLTLACIETRLGAVGEKADNIDAILLTHEHIDHLRGVKIFLKNHRRAKVFIPVYVKDFGINGIEELPDSQIEWFRSSEFDVGKLHISCFVLPHDSRFCVGYSVLFEGKKVSIATDLGFVSNDTLRSLAGSDILFLESNHDESLLRQNPRYPAKTKKRILGTSGHLSNLACGLAIVSLAPSGLKQVVLSHLSEENNTPNLAYGTVKKILKEHGIEEGKNLFVDVAFQNEVGTVFNL
jgi:phosphoribosyl 1,2-cyclic phosphodiesterase